MLSPLLHDTAGIENLGYTPETFSEQIYGKAPFYEDPDYQKKTKDDFESLSALEKVAYTYNTEGTARRIANLIISIVIFPIGICHLIHCLAGKFILQSSTPFLSASKNAIESARQDILSNARDKIFKRITVEVDGYKVDALIIGTKSTIQNRRWTLFSTGNAGFYERFMGNTAETLAEKLCSNLLVFNYPGVQSSTGLPSRKAMSKAYRAMLTFLEDPEGIGAKEIIGYGFSIGGAVQAEALNDHTLKGGIKYAFIKDRTFSNLANTVHWLFRQDEYDNIPYIKILRFLCWHGLVIKIVGWNMSCTDSSKKLQTPEIILQKSSQNIIKETDFILGDGTIHKNASLAKSLLEHEGDLLRRKTFMGIWTEHGWPLTGRLSENLATEVNKILQQPVLQST